MILNGKILFLLCLQGLEVLSAGFKRIQCLSDDYSWLATIEYNSKKPSVYCGGAVISSQFVLTTAQCGQRVKDMGGLVRLSDYTKSPFCVYGTSNCRSSKEFGIENTILHPNFERNDIALVHLNKAIKNRHPMMPIWLPCQTQQPFINTQLTVSGSVLPTTTKELTEKHFKILLIQKMKKYREVIGLLVAPIDNVKNASESYSRRHMVIEGIVSLHKNSSDPNFYTPSNYTRVADYLTWIKNNTMNDVQEAEECPTNSTTNPQEQTDNGTAVHQFPTDCGYSPIYPRELIDSGYKIEPDEFSWLASLVYQKNKSAFGHCSGSVISAHYVLTTRNCVINKPSYGKLIGVRLGVFHNESTCDYGTQSCQHYEEFGILYTKVVKNSTQTKNKLALIKLDRDIKFGPKMKPICLPFGDTDIPPPFEDSFLTVAGWWTTTYPNDVIAKRSAAVAFWNTTSCVKARLDKERQVCGVKPGTSPCTVELGSPLMNMFERRRMVLEAIGYDKVAGCTDGTDVGTLYTRVRSFKTWIEDSIQELETRSENDEKSHTKTGKVNK